MPKYTKWNDNANLVLRANVYFINKAVNWKKKNMSYCTEIVQIHDKCVIFQLGNLCLFYICPKFRSIKLTGEVLLEPFFQVNILIKNGL